MGVQTSDGTLTYAMDHLGSVHALLDGAAAVRARYEYDPFLARRRSLVFPSYMLLVTPFGCDIASRRLLTPSYVNENEPRAFDSAVGRHSASEGRRSRRARYGFPRPAP